MRHLKKILSLILCFAMLVGYIPASVFAEDIALLGLCEHHTEHTGCFYSPAVEEQACQHQCNDDCYIKEEACLHIHAGCETSETLCDHVCSEDDGCITKKLTCAHVHDETCGYAEAKEATACDYVCAECAKQDDIVSCDATLSCEAEEHREICEKKLSDDKIAAEQAAAEEAAKLAAEQAAAEAAAKVATDQAAADGVAVLIDALLSLEEIQAKPMEEQTADYNQVQGAYEAYEQLTESQKSLLPPAEDVFKPYFDYFNSLTAEVASHSHFVCGTTCSCSNMHSNQIWEPLPTGTTTLTSGNYYLESSITFTGYNELIIDGNVSICLNGNNIYKNGTSSVVIVRSGTLTLTDCKETGKIQVTSSDKTHFSGGGALCLSSNGSLDMYGGTVSCNALGAAIHCDTTGDLTIYNGTVDAYYEAIGVHTVNDVTIYSGTITSSNSAGLCCGGNNSSATFHNITISGGYFEGQKNGAAFGKYTCTGKVTISGGEFYGKGPVPNATTYGYEYYGFASGNGGAGQCDIVITGGIFRGARGGFYNYNPLLNATISGGTFHSKYTSYTSDRDGIRADNGTFLIEGGTIYGIQHTSSYSVDTSITVTGGEILCIRGYSNSSRVFTIKVYDGTIGQAGTQVAAEGIISSDADIEVYGGTITGTKYAIKNSQSSTNSGGSLLVSGGILSGQIADIFIGKVETTAENVYLSMRGYTGSTITVALPSSVSNKAYVAKNVSAANIISISDSLYDAAYDSTNEAVYLTQHVHTYQEAIISPPTHMSEGIKSFTCTCGDTYNETIEKLSDHEWDGGAITADPTCTENGIKTFSCPCGETYTEEIALIDHNMDPITGKCKCGHIMAEALVNIGETTSYYQTLGEAVTAAAAGTKAVPALLVLQKDIDLGEGYQQISSGVLTIDLNSHEISSAYSTYGSYGTLYISGSNTKVTIQDSGDGGKVVGTGFGCNVVYVSRGTLIINSGTIRASVTGDAVVAYNSDLIITGGTLAGGMDALRAHQCDIVISGGELIGSRYNGGMSVSSSDVNISGGKVSYNVSATDGSTLVISGGEIIGNADSNGLHVANSTAIISGGSISSNRCEIESYNASVVLTVAEDKSEGARFPSGIKVSGISLNDMLDEGMAYWSDNTMLQFADSVTEITGSIIVKAKCNHANTTYSANDDGTTHTKACGCGYTVTEGHTGGTATCKTKAVCDLCNASYGEIDPINHESTEFTYEPNTDSATHTKKHACCDTISAANEVHNHKNGKCVCGIKATPVVTAPTANTLTYNGQAQVLVTMGETNVGTMKYAMAENGTYGGIPEATNAGTYTVWYKVEGDDNYNDVVGSVSVTILPKVVTAPKIDGIEAKYRHTGEAIAPVPTAVKDGTVVIDASEYTVDYENNVAIGVATVKIVDKEGGNYTVSGSKTFQIVVHEHEWSYATSENNGIPFIKATCTNVDGFCPNVDGGTVSMQLPSNRIYDGTSKDAEILYNTWKPENVSLSYNNVDRVNVTGKEIFVTLSAGQASFGGRYQIAPKEITSPVIEGINEKYLHTGNAITPVPTAVKDGETVIASSEYTLTYENNIAVGTATVKIVDKEGGNYTVSGSKMFQIEYASSGSCGDNVTWSLAEDGTLTISGNGPMKVILGKEKQPWYSRAEQIKKVVVKEGVTSICQEAFMECPNLEEVIISDTVEEIGACAFYSCKSLRSVALPGNLKALEMNLFANCNSLTSMTLPESLKSIGSQVFMGSGLTEITIPGSVESIGGLAFADCDSLKKVYFEGDPPAIHIGDAGQAGSFENCSLTAYYPAGNENWTENEKQDYDGEIIWKPYGNPATALTISGLDADTYLGQMIGRKDSLRLTTVPADATVDMVYTVTDSSVLEIVDYNDSGCKVIAHKPGTVTVTATDRLSGISTTEEITIVTPKEITVPYEDDISITSSFVNQYYSFTPAVTGRYVFSSTACEKPYTDALNIYIANGDSGTLAFGWEYPAGDKCQVYADLEAGVTYQVQPQYSGITVGRTAKFKAAYLGEAIAVTGVSIKAPDQIECEYWPTNDKIYASGSFTLEAERLPAGSKGTIQWESSDNSIIEAKSSSNTYGGFTTKSCGRVTITATCNGYSDSVTITVKDPEELTVDQWEEVTHDKGNTSHIFKFAPEKTGEYVITMDSEDTYYPQDIIEVTTDGKQVTIPEYGYGVDTQKWYLKLEATQIYYLKIGAGSFNFNPNIPIYNIKIAESSGIPDSMHLRKLKPKADDGKQIFFGTYFTPEGSHDEIIKIEVSDESVLQVYPYWNLTSNHKCAFNVVGEGKVTVTATSKSGLTASYTLYVGEDGACDNGHDYDENHECARCGAIGGTCGENLTWEFDTSTDILTISGIGKMENYTSSSAVPWDKYRTHIEMVVVESGVISIGNYAFFACSSLASVMIPDGVISIADGAFSDCSSMTDIVIPNSVTSIGMAAFYGCSSLSSIIIPDSVSSIGSHAFNGCSSMTSVTLSTNIADVSPWSFMDCKSLTSIVIPDGVTKIQTDAFAGCSSLITVTIPNSVTAIGTYAFMDCGRLKDVYYGGTKLHWKAMSIGTGNTYLTNATIHYTDLCACGYFYGADHLCTNCGAIGGTCGENLTWTFVESTGALTISGTGDMDGYNSSQEETPWSCFADDILSIVIEEGVNSIGTYVFHGCTALNSVMLPDSLATIEWGAFSGCSSLSSIKIPENVTSIDGSAFYSCVALSSISIPAGVTLIHPDTFVGCNNLSGIWVAEKNTKYSSDSYGVLFSKDMTRLVKYPEGRSGAYAIPNGVITIGIDAFLSSQNLTEVIISDTVTDILSSAFMGCSMLKNIIIPSSVEKIDSMAFAFCSGLESITFEGDSPFASDLVFAETTTTAYYPANNPTWTEDTLQDYGGNITWVPFGTAQEIEITVDIPGAANSGAVVTAPEGGWVEGTNTFSVSCEKPCVVAVSYDGGQTYERLTATAAEGGYSFTAEDMTADTIVAVAVRGDANGDGKITNADVTRLRAAFMGKTTVDSLTQLAIDANGDGKISNADVTRLRAVFFGKTSLNW